MVVTVARRTKLPQRRDRFEPLLLLVAALLAVGSLGGALRVYALPTEARTTEAWFGYRSLIGFDFTAHVIPGRFYSETELRPDQLVRNRLPVEPPQYRRATISQFTEEIQVKVPYSFQADRAAPLRANMRVDGVLQVPGVWERPYPLMTRKEIRVDGREISGVATFTIPIKQLLEDIKVTREESGIGLDPVEVLIRPVFLVEASGLREPVGVLNNPEFKIIIRTTTTDIDDPRDVTVEKTLTHTTVTPVTVRLFGSDVSVSALRNASLIVLLISLGVSALLALQRLRRRRDPGSLLAKLGSHVLEVESFQPPADMAVAEVRSVQELIQLQVQTERPVIRVGDTCYLLDGTTCYQFRLDETRSDSDRDDRLLTPEDELSRMAQPVHAAVFSLDPWITEVHIKSAADMLRLHQRSARPVIQTEKGFHLLDGSVCFTYRLHHQAGEASAKAAPSTLEMMEPPEPS